MKDKKILFGTFIALLLLLTTGLSYAYFSTSVSGNDNAKDVVVETGTLKLVYTDSPEIVAEHIKPGWSISKEISVTNIGTLDAKYNLVWQELNNEITNNEMTIYATCEIFDSSNNVIGSCEGIPTVGINNMKIKKNISIESGITHKYYIEIRFEDIYTEQNYNQGKTFSGVIGIEEYQNDEVACVYDGELVQGAEYTYDGYTYRYMQEGTNSSYYALMWKNMDTDGWGVQQTNKGTDETVNGKLCSSINGKPIVSLEHMFSNSRAVSIDLSSFDTSNVVNMSKMFMGSQATKLDLSNFDTSKVTNMSVMFQYSQATAIDLSSFDTSKVTDMRDMFDFCKAASIELSNFDTSNVTDMSGMFQYSDITTLNLSSFDTSKVTNMSDMFYGANDLKTIYVSDKFKIDTVTKSDNMFYNTTSLVGGSGTTYDSTKTDKTYARIDTASTPGYFTAK